MVRLAAGSAVCTYVSITAPSTTRSRSVSGVVKCSNPFQPNKLRNRRVPGQGGDKAVETQPSGGRAAKALAVGFDPPTLQKGSERRLRDVEGGAVHALDGAEAEVDPLEFALRVGEHLARVDRRCTRRDRAAVRLPGGMIPAARSTIEGMGGGTDAEVGATRPVGAVVP